MTSVTFEEGAKVASLGECAFRRCTTLNMFKTPSSVTSIGNAILYGCSSLATFDLSNASKVSALYGLTTIDRTSSSSIFYGIPADCEVILPPYCIATGDHVTIADPGENPMIIADDGYYELATPEHWVAFSNVVQGRPTANARMTADIDLGDDQTTIGTMDNPFQGEFDGQGHTLTINFTLAEERFGVFRFVSGVTIKNLHLKGSINTAYRMVGSFIGRIDGGTCSITNSRSSVFIHSNTDAGHQTGAFVGRVSEGFTLNISDCLFDGSIEGESTSNYCGGIVGYNVGTLNMSNCLFMPGTAQIGSSSTSTLAQSAGSLSISNCYYTTAMGTVQGSEATAADIANGTIATALQNSREETVWVQDPLTNQPMLALFAGKYTVPSSGLGTFSAKTDFTLPEGLEAYYCKVSRKPWLRKWSSVLPNMTLKATLR